MRVPSAPGRVFAEEVVFPDDFGEGLLVGAKGGDACVPRFVFARGRSRRPVLVRKFQRAVVRAANAVEDVALGDAHVLEYLPRRVRGAWRLLALKVRG